MTVEERELRKKLFEAAKTGAEGAGRNARVAPQLLFAHFLWALEDAFELSHRGYSPDGEPRDV
jgi:hypothetical protein